MKVLNRFVRTLLVAFFSLVFLSPAVFAAATTKDSVALVQVATFTTHRPAEGWRAWKRQTVEYHKANPWSKVLAENCAREPRICKRTARPGTAFYLPAPEIRVIVPAGVKAPEAIALVPTATPGVFALDLKTPVVTAHEKQLTEEVAVLKKTVGELHGIASATNEVLLAVTVIFGLLSFGFLALLNEHDKKKRLLHERDIEIARLNGGLDEVLGIVGAAPKLCCSTEATPSTPGKPSPGGGTSN